MLSERSASHHEVAQEAGSQAQGSGAQAFERLETRILVARGRKAVRAKAESVGKVTRKAVKTGLLTGGIAAAAVVIAAVRKQRRAG